MEVGAVKQAFNNEVILLKKRLNQAKIQIIHKLTRKAKTLTEKKAPDHLKEKLKRKAESAVNEVLIIKKLKAKDIAKFIVTHTGNLNEYLNRPKVDQDKACARLLLHKAMQDKYKSIRDRFANVPIQDLFMSRFERKKMKKEAREQQKNKKKGKDSKVVNSEGDWDVQEVEKDDSKTTNDDETSGNEDSGEENEDSSNDNEVSGDENEDTGDDDQDIEMQDKPNNDSIEKDERLNESQNDDISDDDDDAENLGKFVKATPNADDIVISKSEESRSRSMKNTKQSIKNIKKVIVTEMPGKDLVNDFKEPILSKESMKKVKKSKDPNKNKKLNEKIQHKTFKKPSEAPIAETKTVDPFFITSTGEKYMSVVEVRPPDEVKEEHNQGNRQHRRAVMFGHVPKRHNYRNDNNVNKQNGFDKSNSYKTRHNNNDNDFNDKRSTFNIKSNRSNFNDRSNFDAKNDRNNEEKVQKLHPSWEAKKKQSGILPFQGKKTVFDEG